MSETETAPALGWFTVHGHLEGEHIIRTVQAPTAEDAPFWAELHEQPAVVDTVTPATVNEVHHFQFPPRPQNVWGFRIRRACYDKPHRCPGWAGGGFRYAKHVVCADGYIPYSDSKFDHLLFKRCTRCGTVRLPIAVRWLDPRWIRHSVSWLLRSLVREAQWRRQMRRER